MRAPIWMNPVSSGGRTPIHRFNVYSKADKLDAALNDGDRVEIYRPIICDPKTVPRKAKACDAAEE